MVGLEEEEVEIEEVEVAVEVGMVEVIGRRGGEGEFDMLLVERNPIQQWKMDCPTDAALHAGLWEKRSL